MLMIEMVKIKLTGGNIGYMLFIEMAKMAPFWNYANYRDGQE